MEKKWLIKIKDDIQGPFTMEELKEMVSQNKLSSKDEVNVSQGSWVYAYAVKELEFIPPEGTSSTVSQTFLTENERTAYDEDYLELEEVEKKSFEDSRESTEVPPAEEISYVPLEGKRKSSEKPITRFEDAQQMENQLKVSHLSKTIWQVVIVGFSLSVFGVIWLNLQKQDRLKEELPIENTYQSLRNARDLFGIGVYKESFDLFQSVSKQNASLLEVQDWMKLSQISVQKVGRIYEARRFLDQAQKFDDFDEKQGQLLKGVIEFSDTNYPRALEAFKKSSDLKSSLVYQFILYVVEKNFSMAQEVLNQLEPSDSLVQFLNSAGVHLFSLEGKKELGEGVKGASLEGVKGAYAQEISFVNFYMGFKQNLFENPESEIQKILNQDPYLTQESHVDLFSPSLEVLWKHLLLESCSSWFQQVGETSYSLALYAFCQAQSGLHLEAQALIEKSMQLHPKDPLILSVYFYIFSKEFSDWNRYQIYIDRALVANEENFILPILLKARSCQRQSDYQCAYEHWSLIQPQNVYIQAGLSQALYFLGKTEQAFEMAEKGIKEVPSYLPFHQILFLKQF